DVSLLCPLSFFVVTPTASPSFQFARGSLYIIRIRLLLVSHTTCSDPPSSCLYWVPTKFPAVCASSQSPQTACDAGNASAARQTMVLIMSKSFQNPRGPARSILGYALFSVTKSTTSP